MASKMISKERLEALENLEQIARGIDRRLSGPYHYPGYHDDIDLMFRKLKVAVHELDRIEGNELPVGYLHSWQEVPTRL
jgi:hypothetical protein